MAAPKQSPMPSEFFSDFSLALCARRGGKGATTTTTAAAGSSQQAEEELQGYHCQRTYIHYTLECGSVRAEASTGGAPMVAFIIF